MNMFMYYFKVKVNLKKNKKIKEVSGLIYTQGN